MTLDARKGKFLIWVERQLKKTNQTGKRLVVALLNEVIEFKEQKPTSEFVASLGPEVLEQIAGAVRDAAGTYFTGLPDEATPDVNADGASVDLANLAEAIGAQVSQADLLLRDLTTWLDRASEPVRRALKGLQAAGGVSAIIDAHRQSSAFNLAAGLSSVRFLQQFTEQSDWLRKLGSSPWNDLSGLTKSIAAMDNISPAWAAAQRSHALAIGSLWRQSELSRFAASLPDTALIGQVHKQFGLGKLSAVDGAFSQFKGVMAQAMADHTSAIRMAAEAAGYASMSRLAFEGTVPAGVSADILRNFDQVPNPETPYFAEALRRGQTLEEMQDVEGLLAVVQRLFDQANTDRKGDNEEAVWLGRLGLLFTILSLLVGGAALYLQAHDKSEAYLEKIEAHSAKIETTTARLLEETTAARVAAAAKARLRYVPHRTPLRAEPNGPLIRYVFPDQTLKATKAVGNWVYVEVFSYENEVVVSGWVYRGNLRIAPAT